MAKGKQKKPKIQKSPEPSRPDPLRPGLDAFARGAYSEARAEFDTCVGDNDRSDSERKMAERFIAATRLDRTTLLFGLGCLGIYALVLVVTLLKQP